MTTARVSAITRPLPAEADDELQRAVARARLGSEAAFAEVVRLVGPRLHRFLVVRLGDERDARDALQETLVAAWQGLPRLRDPNRFWTWVCGIAAHKAADTARRRRPPVAEPEEEPAHERDAASALDVRAALDALPAPLRDVLLLRCVLHLSEQEVAEALGVRVGTVKSRTARARARLLELLR